MMEMGGNRFWFELARGSSCRYIDSWTVLPSNIKQNTSLLSGEFHVKYTLPVCNGAKTLNWMKERRLAVICN